MWFDVIGAALGAGGGAAMSKFKPQDDLVPPAELVPGRIYLCLASDAVGMSGIVTAAWLVVRLEAIQLVPNGKDLCVLYNPLTDRRATFEIDHLLFYDSLEAAAILGPADLEALR